jgi:hypothetical protein
VCTSAAAQHQCAARANTPSSGARIANASHSQAPFNRLLLSPPLFAYSNNHDQHSHVSTDYAEETPTCLLYPAVRASSAETLDITPVSRPALWLRCCCGTLEGACRNMALSRHVPASRMHELCDMDSGRTRD